MKSIYTNYFDILKHVGSGNFTITCFADIVLEIALQVVDVSV